MAHEFASVRSAPESMMPDPINLLDVGHRILRRWPDVLITLVLVTLAAVALGLTLPQQYSASTTVVVSPLRSDPAASPSARDTVNIATEREIFESKEVAQRAVEKLGEPPEAVSRLLANSEVVAPEGSQILRVTVKSNFPEEAARSADAVAEAYLDFRREGGIELAQRYIEDLDARLDDLNEEANTAAGREQIRSLTEERRALALFGQDPGRIIGRAALPSSATSPGLVTFALAGIVGGLILGVPVALLRDRFDPRVRFVDRLEHAVGTEPILLEREDDVEALRWLRRTLLATAPQESSPLSILVASTGTEAHSSIVHSLAAVFRDGGMATHVIEAAAHDAADIDKGWDWVNRNGGRAKDVILIDAQGLNSRASLAELADRAGLSVLVATAKSRTTSVRDTWELLSKNTPGVATYLRHPSHARTERPRPRRTGPRAAARASRQRTDATSPAGARR